MRHASACFRFAEKKLKVVYSLGSDPICRNKIVPRLPCVGKHSDEEEYTAWYVETLRIKILSYLVVPRVPLFLH
eukprot:scaffold1340_cov122-Cylindrotheca_fusiformis.AAC.16